MNLARFAPLALAAFFAVSPAHAWKVDKDGVTQLKLDDGGNLGIGASAPTAKLEVAGQVKITGGSPGANKVLTSDANGLASWQTPAAGGGSGTIVGGGESNGTRWGSTRWGSCTSGTFRCMSNNGDGVCVSFLCIQ